MELSDEGLYTCVASSRNGKSTWSAKINIEENLRSRPFDHESFPGAPSKPQIVNRTEDSVTITWNRSNKIGSSSLLGYQVSVARLPSPRQRA